MARKIAIYNQKGGVGKTTTAMNLAAYLSMHGYRTLLVDFDPQFNATAGLGVRHGADETIYHALLAGQKPEAAIKSTHLAHLHVAPASGDLAGALVELVNVPEREFRLRNFVRAIEHRYDFVFVDLPPTLNLLTVNGLLAADEVIVPVQCEYYSLEGLGQLLQTIDLIKNNVGHPLKVAGALLTMYDKRERLSREVAREVRKRFPYHVYEAEIPRSVSLAEAPSFQRPVALHAPMSPGAEAYEKLAREVAAQYDAQPFERAPVPETPREHLVEEIVSGEEDLPAVAEMSEAPIAETPATVAEDIDVAVLPAREFAPRAPEAPIAPPESVSAEEEARPFVLFSFDGE